MFSKLELFGQMVLCDYTQQAPSLKVARTPKNYTYVRNSRKTSYAPVISGPR